MAVRNTGLLFPRLAQGGRHPALRDDAQAAGWKHAANAFAWTDTIQHVGKVVVVPSASGAQESFDLDEVGVSGSAN